MNEMPVSAVEWEAAEFEPNEKGSDWYWALGIVAIAGAVAAIVLGNTLFGVVILLGASTMLLFAGREPNVVHFGITQRGVRIGNKLYPYSTLKAYYIDEEHAHGPQLLVESERMFMPILVLPIPEEHLDDIDDILATRLPEEHLEEPLAEKILEFFGF